MGKVKGNKPQTAPKVKKQGLSQEQIEENKKERRKLVDRSTFLVAFTAIALIIIFAGRWIMAFTNGYYDTFIKHGSGAEEALATAGGLTPTDDEEAILLTYEKEWDLYKSSRLCDQLTVEDEYLDPTVSLHGYFYDNDSDITVIYLHQFGQDGTTDFLAGSWFYENLDCNILMPDARDHGQSEGDYVGYGCQEDYDLEAWIEYLDQTYGDQTYIIWGVGMGANTALYADSEELLPDSVAYVVAESPYPSLITVAKKQMKAWYTVPAFPSLNFMEMKLNGSDAGFTTADLDLLTELEDGAANDSHVPVLFLTSDNDTYIYADWTAEVYAAYAGEKSVIQGSGSHGTVFALENDQVTQALEELNEQYVK